MSGNNTPGSIMNSTAATSGSSTHQEVYNNNDAVLEERENGRGANNRDVARENRDLLGVGTQFDSKMFVPKYPSSPS
ncbi:hypothetical protein SAMD00023353_1500090 [Rosellinia necatrix]|uniref:Uncharacterized protein n=1 Tax=Rosellinia necatrix TaxID=77044 RepID=A0A1S8A7B2_ROSNE|nr:hypothetical protein SAMD00023353_1500090 [Rosellinia necatrix]